MVKIGVGVNKVEKRKPIERINETKSWLFVKMSKIDNQNNMDSLTKKMNNIDKMDKFLATHNYQKWLTE